MNSCPFGRCDGSGETRIALEIYGHTYRYSEACECAKRGTIPTVPDHEAALCIAARCEGCPACCPGYVP